MSTETAPWTPESPNLRTIKEVFARGSATIAVCGIVPAIAAIGYLAVVPPRYHASTEVLLDPRGLQVVEKDVTPRSESNESAVSLVESQIRVVRSEAVLRAVVGRLQLQDDREFGRERLTERVRRWLQQRPAEPASVTALRELQRALDARRAMRSYVIVITARSEDPIKAARIANTVAEVYAEHEVHARSTVASRVSANMEARLKELADRLHESDREVERFKVQQNLVGAGGRLVSEQQLSELNSQLILARARTAEQRSRVDQLDRLLKSGSDYAAIAESVQSQTVSVLRTQHAEIIRQQGSAAALLGPRHPSMPAFNAERQRYEQLIKEEIQRIAEAARNDHARAKASEETLAAELDELKQTAIRSNAAMVRLRELERIAESNRQIYQSFLVRAKELNEQGEVDTLNTRIIAVALAPTRPSDFRLSLLVLAIVLGLGAGAAYVWRRENRVLPRRVAHE